MKSENEFVISSMNITPSSQVTFREFLSSGDMMYPIYLVKLIDK